MSLTFSINYSVFCENLKVDVKRSQLVNDRWLQIAVSSVPSALWFLNQAKKKTFCQSSSFSSGMMKRRKKIEYLRILKNDFFFYVIDTLKDFFQSWQKRKNNASPNFFIQLNLFVLKYIAKKAEVYRGQSEINDKFCAGSESENKRKVRIITFLFFFFLLLEIKK